MAKFISYINPFRFRPYANSGGLIVDDMTRIDKMANQTQYYKGIYPLKNYTADWKLNEEIVIQIQSDDAGFIPQDIEVTTPSGVVTVTAINVTPSGRVGNNVYNYEYTPTEVGEYYFTTYYSSGVNWISDTFRVHSNEMNLVEIKYYDTDNRFDGVFYDGSTLIWQPKAYFTGIQTPGKPNADYDIYTDDPAQPTRTNAETTRVIKLQLTDITTNHYSQIIDITSCDTIFVNSQPCLNPEIFEDEETVNSDKVDITINMTRIETDNFVKNY